MISNKCILAGYIYNDNKKISDHKSMVFAFMMASASSKITRSGRQSSMRMINLEYAFYIVHLYSKYLPIADRDGHAQEYAGRKAY